MKPHSLLRLTSGLSNLPLLISQDSFNSIASYLSNRNASGMLPMPMAPVDDQEQEDPDDLDDIIGVGVINVCGPLTNKSTGWEAECGGCSYESIVDSVDEMIESGVSTIVLNVDSGGGESFNCFQSSDIVRQMCDDAGVQLIGYCDGMAASAAYAWICVCDEVVCHPQGEVGSIGVLISLMDKSQYLKNAGLKPIFISAGKEKIPFTDDGTFTPEFLKDLQNKVDFLYEGFCSHVSNYTGLSIEDVKNTDAKCFMAQDALKLGLVNKIMTNQEFVKYIAEKQGAMNA